MINDLIDDKMSIADCKFFLSLLKDEAYTRDHIIRMLEREIQLSQPKDN